MKHSIRTRFTVLFLIVFFVVLLAAVCVNNWGLERFYRARKVEDIEKAYRAVNELVMKEGNGSAKLPDLLKEYSDKYNITIAVMDSDNDRSVVTTERGSDYLLQRAQSYLFSDSFRESSEILKETDDYQIISTHDPGGNRVNIDCFAFCGDNQTLLLMSTPAANLTESVRLANRFLSYVGLLMAVLGIVLGVFLTRRITQPIQRLAALSAKMGSLDFTERYTGDYEDEIGVLGHSMNTMAEKLEETISELQDANKSLQEDIRRKEEIDEMRREFIANVSHELKTPIALIQGYAEGLNDGLCEDPESRKEYLDVIIDEAGRMNSLVKQLLNLSKLESGAPEMEIGPFDLADMIRSIVGSTKLLAEEKQASVAFASDQGQALPVLGDTFQIEDVLTNYVSNAIHHVDEGGRIVIRAEEVPGPTAEPVRAAGSGQAAESRRAAGPDQAGAAVDAGSASSSAGSGKWPRIRVHVENTGSSIPEKDLPHIWDKFYKVDKSHSRSYGGSGIGLSIVKAVMEAHGMGYGAANTETGVDFWFELEKDQQSNH